MQQQNPEQPPVTRSLRRLASAGLAALCALACAPQAALAQAYPSRLVRIIVPLPPGSTLDLSARAIGQSLSPAWGQPIIVENRAGANGNIAMEACAKAPADGYTLCLPDGNIMTLNPFAYANLPYDPMSFTPIIHIGDMEQSITVHASVPAKNMKELIEYARSRPGQVTWGSGGRGSTMHLYLEWLQAKTGVKFNHIQYKGPPDLARALASGEVEATNLSTATVAPFIRDGRMRMIAVIAGKQRSQFAGDAPSFAEQGFDLDFRNWLALFFPRGVPADIVRRWNGEVNRLLADKGFADKTMAALAVTAAGGSPEDLARVLDEKRRLGAELTKIANLRFD